LAKYFIIFFLLIASVAHAQHGSGYVDFGSDFANSTYNDTDLFSGPGILGASDVTASLAFQTLDASGVTLITACAITDSYCFQYSSTTQQLTLYVNGSAQVAYPQLAAAIGTDILLLESGDALLLENGTDSILLEE